MRIATNYTNCTNCLLVRSLVGTLESPNTVNAEEIFVTFV